MLRNLPGIFGPLSRKITDKLLLASREKKPPGVFCWNPPGWPSLKIMDLEGEYMGTRSVALQVIDHTSPSCTIHLTGLRLLEPKSLRTQISKKSFLERLSFSCFLRENCISSWKLHSRLKMSILTLKFHNYPISQGNLAFFNLRALSWTLPWVFRTGAPPYPDPRFLAGFPSFSVVFSGKEVEG